MIIDRVVARSVRSLSDFVWGQPNWFCQHHCDRDRRRRIARLETASSPSSYDSSPVTDLSAAA